MPAVPCRKMPWPEGNRRPLEAYIQELLMINGSNIFLLEFLSIYMHVLVLLIISIFKDTSIQAQPLNQTQQESFISFIYLLSIHYVYHYYTVDTLLYLSTSISSSILVKATIQSIKSIDQLRERLGYRDLTSVVTDKTTPTNH